LEIAVGAAMLGVIGIVFSLSIFSVQQVAERGTAYTVREYARDWVFRMTYWALALFDLIAMLSALQRKEFGSSGIWLNLGILLASVLVLKTYFDRAIKFVDPHFTIAKVATVRGGYSTEFRESKVPCEMRCATTEAGETGEGTANALERPQISLF
jgi:hypothetical protein